MLIAIGKVLKPWGVRGEVKVQSLTDFPERFKDLRRVYLVSPRGNEIVCAVKSARSLGGMPLLLLEGYDSPEKARTIASWLIKIPQEEAVPLPEGQYYWFELIGMVVLSEEGERLGEITDVFATGSNDVYVMKRDGGEVYIPATKEIVKQIDRKARTMIIHVMEGLLE
jgi:16S rRNA processing protein RimM